MMTNTNGNRIAHDDRFLAEFNEVRPSLYFQFDGFDPETYRIICDEPDILAKSSWHWIVSPPSVYMRR